MFFALGLGRLGFIRIGFSVVFRILDTVFRRIGSLSLDGVKMYRKKASSKYYEMVFPHMCR